jgi:competence protein ComEA
MRSVIRLNIDSRLYRPLIFGCVGALLLPFGIAQAQLPPGPGREETEKMCSSCHELARSISLRQDRDGWKATINKMLGLGAEGTEQEITLVVDYLATHYPADVLPPLDVNKAKAIDFETRLSLRRSEAAAVIQYRQQHGPFKSIDDLKKVPGINTSKIDAKKDGLVFQPL